MKKIEFTMDTSASPERLWHCMTEQQLFRIWNEGFHPGAYFEGEWREGGLLRFLIQDKGGTEVRIHRCVPGRMLHMEHVAVIDPQGGRDIESVEAREWIGTLEDQDIEVTESGCRLRIRMELPEAYAPTFEKSWRESLQELKSLAESES